MIIDIVDKQYQVGSNRGITAIEEPNLLFKLNLIIEWEHCNFPHKYETDTDGTRKDIGPDLEYLGSTPELKPGNVFLYKGQLISVDSEERLVLNISETGYHALKRIFEEEVKPEIKMKMNNYKTELEWEAVSEKDIPDNYTTFNTKYVLHKAWKEKFGTGRNIFSPDSGEICVKVKVGSRNLVYPITIYMLPWTVKYNADDFGGTDNEEYLQSIMLEVFTYFYDNYRRLKLAE